MSDRGNSNPDKGIHIASQGFSIGENGRFPERLDDFEPANTPSDFRGLIVDWIYQEMVGPRFSEYQKEEFLKISPNKLYSGGILFPKDSPQEEFEDVETQGADEELAPIADKETKPEKSEKKLKKNFRDDSELDEELTLANAYRQSALGLSFLISPQTSTLTIKIFASRYKLVRVDTVGGKPVENVYEKARYQRIALNVDPIVAEIKTLSSSFVFDTPDPFLKIKFRQRLRPDGSRLITLSLFNDKSVTHSDGIQYSDCLYQCGIEVSTNETDYFLPYDGIVKKSLVDEEESQLDLLYRDRKGFALGHGCAVEWDTNNSVPTRLCTSVMPSYKVPPVVPREGMGSEHYSMRAYSTKSSLEDNEVLSLLENIPQEYEHWISNREGEISSLSIEHQSIARSNLEVCRESLARISNGIRLLAEDGNALTAFRLMNRAMVSQQIHYSRSTRKIDDDWEDLNESYDELKPTQGWWRVFQLAFVLANLNGAHRSLDKNERELVDLIWFPTGGGKTEAYLGLSAFTIFYRRLLDPTDSGCTVLMRYTLRLLTVQQFQRAAAMICACEQIRFENIETLGADEISIGLWVGDSLTPNRRSSAKVLVRSLTDKRKRVENRFQLLKCPWCGTALDGDKTGRFLGYAKTGKSVEFLCPEKRCEFSKTAKRRLPVVVIDEDIYERPPSLIIGTVDKFAMLAWNEDAGAIFGRNQNVSPPDLIIQDELHLISGPVGTMVGLYEGAIDLLCEDAEGRGAKIVGSTATIRRAKDQCKALYDRDVMQFPPSGISASDNFFSFEKREDPGRIYLGVCPLSASSFVTGMVRAFSSILEGSKFLPCAEAQEEFIRDGYWTLVQYYNSLRELGRGVTLLQQDIPEWSNSRAFSRGERSRPIYKDDELTSRKTADEIPRILEDLNVCWQKEYPPGSKRPFDSILATNMISVGVDIDRLGIMAVVGQPKTTSEYIQASSRVGRKNHPGLVLACYNPAKPRDRSHFETFTRYHSALYRWVEPTSVTPFSVPALDKALHALIVILSRHYADIKSPSDFSASNEKLEAALEKMTERCHSIEQNNPERSLEFEEKIQSIISRWESYQPGTWGSMGMPETEQEPLMVVYGYEHLISNSFVTPTSLRGVDVECEVIVSSPIAEDDEQTENQEAVD